MAPPKENRFRDIPRETFQGNPSRALQVEREQTRDKFFKGDDRISNQRLDKRRIQDNLENRFRTENLRGTGVKGLTQKKDPLGQDFADYRREVANKYGPTVGEIAADFGRGTERFLQDAAVKFNQGKLGLMGIVSAVADKFNKDYDKLNDVQKEIFENPDKYPNASNIPVIQTQNNSRQLLIDADKAALGLESTAQDATGIPAIGSGSGFDEQPSDLFELRLLEPETSIELRPDLTQKQLNLAEGLGFIDPRYIEQQKAFLDELNISPQVAELLDANEPGGRGNNQGEFMFSEGYTIPGTNITIPSIMRQGEEAVTGGQGFLPDDFTRDSDGVRLKFENGEATPITDEEFREKEEKVNKIFEGDDFFSQVTDFNNPGNLTDVGQAGTTGETYGNNFAVFPNAQAGISALENDLALKVGRSNKVEDIISQYAAGDPNVGRYIDFVTDRVGPTVDQNELDDLRNAVIRFENKPDIAQQYLALVAEGGLMDKKMYGGIIASKG